MLQYDEKAAAVSLLMPKCNLQILYRERILFFTCITLIGLGITVFSPIKLTKHSLTPASVVSPGAVWLSLESFCFLVLSVLTFSTHSSLFAAFSAFTMSLTSVSPFNFSSLAVALSSPLIYSLSPVH